MIMVRSDPEKCWPVQYGAPMEWFGSSIYKKYAEFPKLMQDVLLAFRICNRHNSAKTKAVNEMDKLVDELEEKSTLIIEGWKNKKDDARFWQGKDGHDLKKEIYESSKKAYDQSRMIMDKIEKCSQLCGMSQISTKDVMEEIKYVAKEFSSMEFDSTKETISVTTPEVVLQVPKRKAEEKDKFVNLGKFKITLHYEERDSSRGWNYNITALTPRKPRDESDYIHPHISDGRLCEGEGKTAVGRALKDMRLVDFFCMITSTLNSYNGNSPHYKLEYWQHLPCQECGGFIDPEDPEEGSQCNYNGCNRVFCKKCIERYNTGGFCSVCGDFFCRDHQMSCGSCGAYICKSCSKIVQNQKYCPECAEKAEEAHQKVMEERKRLAEEKIAELEKIRKAKADKEKEAKPKKTKKKAKMKTKRKEMTPEMQAILEEERKFMEEEIAKLGGAVQTGPRQG